MNCPRCLSHQWASPQQDWHTVYGNSRDGRWPVKPIWYVCWSLGFQRLEEAGVEDFQKERPCRECLQPPEVLEIPGNELRARKKKKKRGKANPILCHLASSTSVQRRFQQDPRFLHLDLKEALCQVVCKGWGRGVVEGRGEKKQKKISPHSCICSNLE